MTHDLETIPLAALSFANIAYPSPGTESVEPSDPSKARITTVSTGGSLGLNNELPLDGGDNSDDYIGGLLQNLSPDAIQGFAVQTAGVDADAGRTTPLRLPSTLSAARMAGTATPLLRPSGRVQRAIFDRESCAKSKAAVFIAELPTQER
jgi:hypothetical protein